MSTTTTPPADRPGSGAGTDYQPVPKRLRGFTLHGPLFETDLQATLTRNVRAGLQEAARAGEAFVRSEYGGAGPEGAAARPFVEGRTESHSGRDWKTTAVVSVATPHMGASDATRIRAIAAGRHNPITRDGRNIGTTRGAEGRTGAFRRVASVIERALARTDTSRGMS
jgi:hypothetical protein